MNVRSRGVLMNDEPGAGGGGTEGAVIDEPLKLGSNGDLDLAAAVDEIGSGLGLEREEPAATPAPTPAPSAAPSSAPAARPAPTSAPASGPAGFRPADITKAPDTWSNAVKAQYDALPPEVKAEVHKREEDMWKGIEQYKGAANFARGVAEVLAPVYEDLKANNVTPQTFVNNLTQAHVALANQSRPAAERAVMAAAYLEQNYGIKLVPAADDGSPIEPAYVDPQVKGLQDEISRLKSRLDGADTNAAQQQRSKVTSELETFASDPANPYFYEVADDIAVLIRGSGGQMKLKDAYDKAVYANPVTRTKEIARLQIEAQAKAAKEAKDRVEAAKRGSAANVETSGHQGSGTAAQGSMDDTMAATLRDIQSRK